MITVANATSVVIWLHAFELTVMSTIMRKAAWVIAISGGLFLGSFFAPYEVTETRPISRLFLLVFGALATAVATSWKTCGIAFARVQAIHLLIAFALLTGAAGLAINLVFAVEGVPAFAIYCLFCTVFI